MRVREVESATWCDPIRPGRGEKERGFHYLLVAEGDTPGCCAAGNELSGDTVGVVMVTDVLAKGDGAVGMNDWKDFFDRGSTQMRSFHDDRRDTVIGQRDRIRTTKSQF